MEKKILDKIRAREQAATPGPWTAAGCDNANAAVYTKDNYEKYENGIDCYLIAELRRDDDTADPDQFNAWNDAQFIAHAREDIPFLFDEIATLKSKNEQFEEMFDKYLDLQFVDERLQAIKGFIDATYVNEQAAIKEMMYTIDAYMQTNQQLRAENKSLKSSAQGE